jgi:hypothetical protein
VFGNAQTHRAAADLSIRCAMTAAARSPKRLEKRVRQICLHAADSHIAALAI